MSSLLRLSILFIAFVGCCYCEPGKPCDPAFYDKYVRPVSDAADALYKVQGTSAEKSASDALSTAIHKSDTDIIASQISVPPNNPDPEGYISTQKTILVNSKGCLGLKAPYLTCHKDHSVCACKTAFPFSNTENVTTGTTAQCYGNVGSVCAIDKGFQLPCNAEVPCAKEGIDKTRFCGGVTEYQTKQKESGVNHGENVAANYMPIIITSIIVSVGAILRA